MFLRLLFFFFFGIIFISNSHSQSGFSGEVNLEAYLSSKEELAFWLYKNKRGRVSETGNFSSWFSAKQQWELGRDGVLELGGGFLFRDGLEQQVLLDEVYMNYQNSFFRISLGRRQRDELYNGLSATNENILWSLNARPLPGLEMETTGPVYFTGEKGLGFEARWADYYLGRDRHVQDALVHHKMFRIVFKTYNSWQFKVGIQHFAQWAGTSPDRGKQPSQFSDYLKIVTGRGGGEEALQGDQNNALGNHLGSWEIYVTKEFLRRGRPQFKLGFIYNNIFEDGSGSRLDNFPDGRYGIFYETSEKNKLVNSLIYEFFYTRHQSHDVNRWGADNYLGHAMTYNSGWTYQNLILGAPFFGFDPEENFIYNNKFSAHHFGLAGQFSTLWNTYPYRILLSFAHNEGTFRRGITPNEDALHLFGEFRVLNHPVQINLQPAASFSNREEPIFAGGISLRKRF